MAKVLSRKKLISLLSPVALCMLGMQANAEPYIPPIPSVPKGWEARLPIHLKSNFATSTPGGMSPAKVAQAYNFPSNYQGAGEVIAIIDAYDDPNIEADLNTFSTQFDLPACTTANGCFTKMFTPSGPPQGNTAWAEEIALDVEWAHAMAPQAKILLVEAADAANDLYNAVAVAISQNPSVITMSWGGGEFSSEVTLDPLFQNSPCPVVASTGDYGTGTMYPSTSPYVVAAGGTQLTLDANGNYVSEVAWNSSGGGVSLFEPEPAFQTSYVTPQASGMRGVPDVAYNASPGSGFSIYDTYGKGGWLVVGGTSASAPQWAALIADMKSAKKGNFGNFNASLYSVAREYSFNLIHDVTSGSNGGCGYYCTAHSGYDYVTGLGSPNAGNLINRFN